MKYIDERLEQARQEIIEKECIFMRYTGHTSPYEYDPDLKGCNGKTCEECWNQEVE